MVEANIGHEVEDRLRNIEAHLGIGHVDEETGEYTVDQAGDKPEEVPEEVPGNGEEHPDEHEE